MSEASGARIGRVVRIQVQREPLKVPHGYYDPAYLTAVPAAELGVDGVVGIDPGGPIVDAHHRRHPRTRGGGNRALSVGFTGHYVAMARRFGDRVAPGIAGENLIVDGPPLRMNDLTGGLIVVTGSGEEIALAPLRPAAPCREFTTFLLGGRQPRPRDEIAEELAFLSEGTRGFIASVEHLDGTAVVSVGDEVYLAG